MMAQFPSLVDCIAGASTPLVQARQLPTGGNTLLLKMEGAGPGGSGKDRPALHMIRCAEERGRVKPGDTLIEATSGNTGISLAMVAAVKGYSMLLVMPRGMSRERRWTMQAYGAEIIEVEGDMEEAQARARQLEEQGRGLLLNQFSKPDNPEAHYLGTGPEIWRQREGRDTHLVSALGTAGTIMGVSRFLKEQNPAISVIAVQPGERSCIPGTPNWRPPCMPAVYRSHYVDRFVSVRQADAEETARLLARREGLLSGVSSGGVVWAALELCREVRDAVVVTVLYDRGDRYLSTGLFAPTEEERAAAPQEDWERSCC